MRPAPRLTWAVAALLAMGCSYITSGELQGRLDPDGDGVPASQDCDEGDPTVGLIYRFLDSDRDGVGAGDAEVRCVASDGWADVGGDCNDLDALAFPGADERCNGADDDCDGLLDEDPVDQTVWFVDRDGDGFGASQQPTVESCDAPAGFIDNGDDCDDADPEVGEARTFYDDRDRDGYGDPDTPVESCVALNLLRDASDCDDSDPDINPGAAERCDPDDRDEDCDGLSDNADDDPEGEQLWFADVDGDGYGSIDEVLRACDDPVVEPHEHRGVPHAAHAWVGNDLDCLDAPGGFDPSVPSDCPFVEVSVGATTGCFRQSNGRVICAGANDAIIDEAPSEALQRVSVGLQHACGIDLDDELVCWGDGPADSALADVEGDFVDVDIEVSHTCARTSTGDVKCWGDHIAYTVSPGDGDDDDDDLERRSPGFFRLDSGPAHACALLAAPDDLTPEEGEPLCFGNCSSAGECDEPGIPLTDVGAGRDFSCGLLGSGAGDSAGHLWCWGETGFDASAFEGQSFQHLSAAWNSLCAVGSAGQAVCQAGLDATGTPVVDLTPPDGVLFLSVEVGARVACGITSDADWSCWGDIAL